MYPSHEPILYPMQNLPPDYVFITRQDAPVYHALLATQGPALCPPRFTAEVFQEHLQTYDIAFLRVTTTPKHPTGLLHSFVLARHRPDPDPSLVLLDILIVCVPRPGSREITQYLELVDTYARTHSYLRIMYCDVLTKRAHTQFVNHGYDSPVSHPVAGQDDPIYFMHKFLTP